MVSAIRSVLNLFSGRRQRQLARTRKALNETEFVQQIADQGGDRIAAVAMWGFLKEWGYRDKFTPYPTDDFDSLFGIDVEEVEDLLIKVLKDLNVSMPSQKLIDAIGPVNTPLRVALLVARCQGETGTKENGKTVTRTGQTRTDPN